jgi:hypothetical protein
VALGPGAGPNSAARATTMEARMKVLTAQRLLAVYSGVVTLALTAALLSGFSPRRDAQFDTITVQRINVVEPDGTLRMVLSNNKLIPNIIIQGHEYPDYGSRKASTAAGILFYDTHATESGGLTFGGQKDARGRISRWGHLSFDRFNQDQMFTIDARDDGTNHASSIKMLDQPAWPIQDYLQLLDRIQKLTPEAQEAAVSEFFETHPPGAGLRTLLTSENYPDAPSSSRNGLDLHDASGIVRARLALASDGTPALEFLDANGRVTHRYPPSN